MMTTKTNYYFIVFLSAIFFVGCASLLQSRPTEPKIDLTGQWRFAIDSLDMGIKEHWFEKKLTDEIKLPGSMTTNGKGNDVDVNTSWTGDINDSTWYKSPDYAKYRKNGNVKIPFFLQPVKHYKGAAWYQKDIVIPKNGYEAGAELFIERSHWESTVWIDGHEVGMRNSLGTPHRYILTKVLEPGKHQLTIRIDNRIKDIKIGPNSHSATDHTQTNWNGMIGDIFIKPLKKINIEEIELYPNLKEKNIIARINLLNRGADTKVNLRLLASQNSDGLKLSKMHQEVDLKNGLNKIEVIYPMGDNPILWDEFNPFLYQMEVEMKSARKVLDNKTEVFGMRKISADGNQLLINNKPVFLRGTLESGIFPKTGFPPTDKAAWTRIFKICKEYGLNHVRFHSWCPPKAAFQAADSVGVYLQIESGTWANGLGEGAPVDQFIYDESERIVKEYGNHPSFVLMAHGNEPGGINYIEFLTKFVTSWKAKDSRRLYTSGAGWPAIPENDYNNIPEPRIQAWGAGLNSIINKEKPRTDYDWRSKIQQFSIPTVSHEIGQWCVYPDFKEIKKYSGVLKAKNFEIFEEKLNENGMGNLAEDFLMASGKLQALCYKADIEAAFRTPDFGGFQLLDLHDFPGQGTALVGVLNAFWENKGYIDAKQFSQFTNTTVPLAKFPKMTYLNSETLQIPVEIAHYGPDSLKNVMPKWEIIDSNNKVYASGEMKSGTIPLGNKFHLGNVKVDLGKIVNPSKMILKVHVNDFSNQWDFFVYPEQLPEVKNDIYITSELDKKALDLLDKGESVLLTLKKGTLKADKGGDIAIGFSSIFWNTAWTRGQAPVTLGILCDPMHPAFSNFPTEYHSNWQWWDAMTHSNAIKLNTIHKDLKPIVRVIDDWVTARPLGLVFECRVGKGKLLISGIDFNGDLNERPEAKQLLYSLKIYMGTDAFQPEIEIDKKVIMDLSI